MDWKPLYDKMLVRRDPPETEYAPGLVVADAHKQQQNVGVVVEVGAGRWVDGILLPMTVTPGMRVIFSKFAGHELAGARDMVILREDEILAYGVPDKVVEQPTEARPS